jgi:serine protease Do
LTDLGQPFGYNGQEQTAKHTRVTVKEVGKANCSKRYRFICTVDLGSSERMIQFTWRLGLILAVAWLVVSRVSSSNLQGDIEPALHKSDPQLGQQFQVPYRLTETNHFLVRVRINGKGPFNFLVDSGAPALFIATETAKKIGIKPDPGEFWTAVNTLDLEGGAHLTGVKARVEDPFQLVGMNALGLPGASIDGILGFTILARFRLEIDLTKDRMIWTRLNHEPDDPPVPKHKAGEQGGAPIGVQAMSVLGPLAKGVAFLMGKQPEEERQLRGFLGLEWSEKNEEGRKRVFVVSVLADSPAAHGGVHAGDHIIRLNDHAIESLKDARNALTDIRAGDQVALIVDRGPGTDNRELRLALTVGEGL